MTFTEDDLLPVSALQHLAFCPRQWALIHLEAAWLDNRLTAEGSVMHENAHDDKTENRGDFRITRALRLRSLRLGLIGQADVVEFHKSPGSNTGTKIEGASGLWQPYIVEYKHGKPKIGHEDEVQLCAQVLCLEEMLNVKIPVSAFFYGQPRHRQELLIGPELRRETEDLISKLHQMTAAGTTPPPLYSPRCRNCSLIDICLPKLSRKAQLVQAYIRRQIAGPEEPL